MLFFNIDFYSFGWLGQREVTPVGEVSSFGRNQPHHLTETENKKRFARRNTSCKPLYYYIFSGADTPINVKALRSVIPTA